MSINDLIYGLKMEIDRLLHIARHIESEKEVVEMIISNRINYYCGDEVGAAVTIKDFGLLADDILKWHQSKSI